MNNARLLTAKEAVKVFYGTDVYETDKYFLIKGCSIFHGSDITHLLPKKIKVDSKGYPITVPFFQHGSDTNLNFIFDPEMDFYGIVHFYFGDFHLTEGGLLPCFTPRHPSCAQDLIVAVSSIDGAFFNKYGSRPDKRLEDVKYFQRTKDYDYWVIPFGFSKALYGNGQPNGINWQSLRARYAAECRNF